MQMVEPDFSRKARAGRRAIEKRLHIQKAARRLLLDREDFLEVTMDQIALSADVAKGTLYNSFPSKDDLYASLAMEVSELVLVRLKCLERQASLAEQVRLVVTSYLDSYAELSAYRYLAEYCRRLDYRNRLSPATQLALSRIEDAYAAYFAELFSPELAKAGPESVQLSFQVAEACLVGALTALWHRRIPDAQRPQFAEKMAALIAQLVEMP